MLTQIVSLHAKIDRFKFFLKTRRVPQILSEIFWWCWNDHATITLRFAGDYL